MTVRWKPLLILSGVFLIIAVVGVVAITYTLVPRGSADILPVARAERSARNFDKAKIHYQRALQKDGRNPAIHEEMADLYAEWAAQAPAEKQGELQYERLKSLIEAAKFGRKLREPRQKLLADAMRRDLPGDSLLWGKELLTLDPAYADAHYVVASALLDDRAPNLPEIKKHVAALEAAKAAPARLAWLKVRLTVATGDDAARDAVLSESRTLSVPTEADPVDRTALLQLRALDVETTKDLDALTGRVQALQTEARGMLLGQPLAPARIARLSAVLERAQKSLTARAADADPKAKATLTALVEAIEGDVETIFQKALAATAQPDLQIYLSYADHLRFRHRRDECLKVVERGLQSPLAKRPPLGETVMGLHALAVESVLANVEDKGRYTKAAPHIKELIECALPRHQGLGHLFQGAIELEQSGVAATPQRQTGRQEATTAAQQKLRVGALGHLKIAATQLPDIAEAQARYGVALVLTMEQNLGRQYLQNAMRLGSLDPQYQIWAAWSMVQAGYPEEAEPIVTALLNQVLQGQQPRSLEGTLHLLNGEIYQSRRTPEDLKRALEEYQRAVASGQPANTAVQLRLAQIDIQLGKTDRAMLRLKKLEEVGQGGPAAEHLTILTLQQQGKTEELWARLAKAREQFPDSDELVALEAALLTKADKPRDADKVLAAFLAREPENVGILLMRAQILSDVLGDTKEARTILARVADHCDNSAPLVQLTLLDLKQRDFAAVSASIAKIRGRWKEAAVGDMLDAQLALDQGNISDAVAHFEEALKKDPNNKLVQFWKAQLDSRNGDLAEASKAFEGIVRDKPVKELDSGQTLMAAAQSALAGLALETGDVDAAIQRFEELKGSSTSGGLTRADRWQLIAAYNAKGQWPGAKTELAALLDDAKQPPTPDERVRAANFYRSNKEEATAQALLDAVIKANPAHPGAVITRAYILAGDKKYDAAIALLSKAIAAPREDGKKPDAVFYLMQAAVENLMPPAKEANRRSLATVEQGLDAQPDSLELIQAKYRLLNLADDAKGALAFVEAKAKDDRKGLARRFLVEVYRERKDYDGAERLLRTLLDEGPKDSIVAGNLVRLTVLQANEATARRDKERETALNAKTAGLIKDFRARFPNDLTFPQADCDLAIRRGELTRAMEISRAMDQVAKKSPSGPLFRARIFAQQGRTREEAEAYAEALERNPSLGDIRLQLGLTRLKLGDADEALRQARLILETDRDQPLGLLLQARALAASTGSEAQVAAKRTQAIQTLAGALEKAPKFTEAYQLKAEIQASMGRRDDAVATLHEALKNIPDDAAALAQLVQRLAEVPPGATAPALDQARAAAEKYGEADSKGNMMLAIAVGYHRAGQLKLALPWAERAAAKLDAPIVHLNFGDLLLGLAEELQPNEPEQAKGYFERAVEQYDRVLAQQPNSVEAINNKAWILLTYLNQGRSALELAQGLLTRVEPAALPGEFFDTLGAIQQASGQLKDAEESYQKGLRKVPDHPVLNFHMGKLIAADRGRASKAGSYLEKAVAGRTRLSPAMNNELNALMHKVSGN